MENYFHKRSHGRKKIMFLLLMVASAGTSAVDSASLEYDPATSAITADAGDFVVTGGADSSVTSISIKAFLRKCRNWPR